MSRSKKPIEYYRDRRKKGNCTRCNKDRGFFGTKTMCRPCADDVRDYQRKRVRKAKRDGVCQLCGVKKRKKKG